MLYEGPTCPNEKPVTSETKGRGSDPRRKARGATGRHANDAVAMATALEQTCVWGTFVWGITRETYNNERV